MECVPVAGAVPVIGDEAAATLDRQAGEVVEGWLQRLGTTIYNWRLDLLDERLRDAAPAMVHGVAEALRRGEPGEVQAPWTQAAREHARLRQSQGVPLGDLLQEFSILRQELRRVLRPVLENRPSQELLPVEEALDGALDTMIGLSAGVYDEELQRERAEAERRVAVSDAVISSAADAVLIYDTQGRILRVNAEAERLAGYRLTEREQLLQGWMGTRIETVDGKPFPPENAPIVRVQRGETVRGVPMVIRRPLHAPVWVSVSAARVQTPSGEELGAVVTAADVTALHELQEETVRLLEEARRARADAEAAQTRLEAVLQQMPSGVIIVEAPSGRLILGNEQAARILGQPFEALAGVEQYPTYRGFHPDGRPYRPQEWPLARSVRAGEDIHDEVIDFWRADGSRGTMSISSAPIHERDGRTVAAVAIFDEITERRQAQEQLRQSEERFRALVETTSDWVWEVDAEGRYTYASPRIRELLGYEPDEVIGKTPFELMPPEEAERVGAIFADYVARQQPFSSLENTNRRKDGRLVVLETSGVPVFGTEGRLAGYRGIDRDITARKQAEQEREQLLAEVQRRAAELEVLFNATPDLSFVMAADSTILDYRKGTTTEIYLPPERFLGRRVREVLPAAVARPHEEGIRRALEERTLVTFEYPLRVAGRDDWYEARILPLDTDRVLVIARNVTDRKRAEAERERLREEAERRAAELDSTISSIADGLIIYNTQGHIVRLNAEAERLLGYGPAERAMTIQERLGLITTAEGRPFRAEEIPGFRALRGETVRGATMSVRRPGRGPFVVTVDAAPIRGTHGRIIGAVATATDVTALHDLQEQTARLLEAERQAREQAETAAHARDEFLAASAHELKTPITNLRGYAQVTMRRLEQEEVLDPRRTRQALGIIDRQSERLARLVKQLLDLASIEAGQMQLYRQETDLVPLVHQLVAKAQAGTRRHTLALQAPPSSHAFVDAERIEQVVANLLDNAVKFSPRGTPIEVELSAPEPGAVRLSVRDHGPGIPSERRPQLFSRFYQAQTGRPFAGLGLGLYYGRKVVELHGGRIWAEFPEDGGSRFVVQIPREAPVAVA